MKPKIPVPDTTSTNVSVGAVTPSSNSWLIANISQEYSGLLVVFVADFHSAYLLEQELSFYLATKNIKILHFADWETLAYDRFSPHEDIISNRLRALFELPNSRNAILVVPIATASARLAPKSYVQSRVFMLTVGDVVDIVALKQSLVRASYTSVSQVMSPGEYALRGSVLDIYPMGAASAYRLDFFDNEIDSIRTFDVDTQRSTGKIERIELLPAKEYPLTQEDVSLFRQKWREIFPGDPRESMVYQAVSKGQTYPGLEYYLPLFFPTTAMIFEYFPDNTVFVKLAGIYEAMEKHVAQVKHRYEQYRHDVTHPLLPPDKIFLTTEQVMQQLKLQPSIELTAERITKTSQSRLNLDISLVPDISAITRAAEPLAKLKDFLCEIKLPILLCVQSLGRRQVVQELLEKNALTFTLLNSWQELTTQKEGLFLLVAPIAKGYIVANDFAVITEEDLFGSQVIQHRKFKETKEDVDLEILNLVELDIGCPVVHIEYGVGRYLGLKTLTLDGITNDFVEIQYADSDKIYVPITALGLITRYSGVDLEHAPLDKLGSDRWQKSKKKALTQVHDVAAELLQIYAKREAKVGYAHREPDLDYAKFAANFPFAETPDQATAIAKVTIDMTNKRPMDRLVCGDVGFGKTEVALRAAAIAVFSGRQVAMLVPTTLLAMQHFTTFCDRFADFPVSIEVVSRLRTKKEQDISIANLEHGKCDIIIGTHKLLSENIKFNKLGLLIVDEEHRFGVRQKEKLKKLKAEVDILTLTATPIPRTLNMAMGGLRDLSLIGTPPLKRLSIKTFVRELSKPLVQEAVARELNRGGQVFFLHNSVATIKNRLLQLQEWLPDVAINMAHGQMPERQLEQVMSDFYHHKFSVLLCTTIIETGIDIPSANTIIIERADKLGLAQLHQLRGRVGRSHHQAYAYCTTPPTASLTVDAKKRLESIEMLHELGSGFSLATHDLEIRGSGELLGEQQSGNIQAIGYSLYMELLQQAVKALKQGKSVTMETTADVEIDLQLPIILPNSYIPDVHTRLVLYKRIANASDADALAGLKVEIIDRFGVLPEQTENLFKVTLLRQIARKLKIKKIRLTRVGGNIEFQAKPNIAVQALVELVQQQPEIYQLAGATKLKLAAKFVAAEERLKFISELLNKLDS